MPEREIAIQHNDNNNGNGMGVFIQNNVFTTDFIEITKQPVQAAVQALSVQKGDYLIFRARPGTSGLNDLVQWNPAVSYVNFPGVTTDANGLDYGQSDYANSFLLSSNQPALIQANHQVEITFPQVYIPPPSDDVFFNLTFVFSSVNTIDTNNTVTFSQKIDKGLEVL